MYLGIYVYIQTHMCVCDANAWRKKEREIVCRGEEGRSVWESLQEQRVGRNVVFRCWCQKQTASVENTLKVGAVGQSGERRTLHPVTGDSGDKDQLSCWG